MQLSCPGAASRHVCCAQATRQPYRLLLTSPYRHNSSKSITFQSCHCRRFSSLNHISPSTQHFWRLPSASKKPCRQRLQALAMVNIEFAQPALWLGMGLIGGGLALYQLRRVTPTISRDADVVISSVAIFSGGILIFQGWRLDPLLLFCQLLTAGCAVVWALEALALRKVVEDEKRFDERTRQYPPVEAPQLLERGIPLPPPRDDDFGRWYDQAADRQYDMPAESSGQEAGYSDEGGYYSNGSDRYRQDDPYGERSQVAYFDDSYSDQQEPSPSGDVTRYDERRGARWKDASPAGSRRNGQDKDDERGRYIGGQRWSSGIEVGSQDDWD